MLKSYSTRGMYLPFNLMADLQKTGDNHNNNNNSDGSLSPRHTNGGKRLNITIQKTFDIFTQVFNSEKKSESSDPKWVF